MCVCARACKGVHVHLHLLCACVHAVHVVGGAGWEEVTLWLGMLQEQVLGPRMGHRGSAESAHYPAGQDDIGWRHGDNFKWESV